MNDLWTVVKLSDNLKDKVSELAETVSTIVTQTIECTIFIREYTGRGFFGMSQKLLRTNTKNLTASL